MRGYSIEGRSKRAKIDEAAVRRIRQLADQGNSTRSLADAYGLTPEAVRRIVRWDTWRWVSQEGPGFVAPSLSPEELAASIAKTMALVAQDVVIPPFVGESERATRYGAGPQRVSAPAADSSPASKPVPSMEESLAAAAREADDVGVRVRGDFARRDGQGDALLSGLLDANVVSSQIPPVVGGTDEGSK